MTAPAHGEEGPLFHRPWWLDAVAPGTWDAVEIDDGGNVAARLPYVVRGAGSWRVLAQPPLTPFLGPWVAPPPPDTKPASVVAHHMEMQTRLEAGLPPAVAFRQSFAPTVPNALPFLWAGYRAEFRYTHRLEDLGSEDALWSGLAANVRGHVRRGRARLEVRDDLGVDDFHRVWDRTFTRQGLAAPDHERLDRIEEACRPRGARTILVARDDEGRVHAAVYVVSDGATAWYLAGGGDPALRASGAASLLLWEAVLRARSSQVAVFDFEGSMLPGVERFFRSFGGRQAPYPFVSRASVAASLALTLRAAWQQRSATSLTRRHGRA